MTKRMQNQRKRYSALGFIEANSVIPKHRLPELQRLTARWRAAAREQQAVNQRTPK